MTRSTDQPASRAAECVERMRCFACDAPIGPAGAARAHTQDGQNVYVGSSCWKRILSASTDVRGGEHSGYQPPTGGPRLWAGWND